MTTTRATADEHRDDPARPLLLRSGQGDREAFAELYDLLAPQVFGLVSSLVRDPAGAEAVTCEAFVEMWHRAPSYVPATCSASAWALLVAHRLAVRARRTAPPTSTAEPARPAGDHEARMTAAGLSPSQTEAVRLAWFDGLDHHRISTEVACGESGSSLLTGALRLLAVPDASR